MLYLCQRVKLGVPLLDQKFDYIVPTPLRSNMQWSQLRLRLGLDATPLTTKERKKKVRVAEDRKGGRTDIVGDSRISIRFQESVDYFCVTAFCSW